MVLKRGAIVAVAFFLVISGTHVLYGEETKDVVVLLDTSSSVMPIYDDLVNYVIGDTLREHVNSGDTFHLLSFNSNPEIEISEKIQTKDDIASILERLLLLQPIGRYTDLILALKYLYQYTIDLPFDREKSIVILTDGIHDPPPGSLFPSNDPNLKTEVKRITEELNRRGWDVRLIKLPSDTEKTAKKSMTDKNEDEESKEGSKEKSEEDISEEGLLDDISEELDVPIVEYEDGESEELSHKTFNMATVIYPDQLGLVGYSFNLPLTFINTTNEEIHLRLKRIVLDNKNILREPVSLLINRDEKKSIDCPISLPKSLEPGKQDLRITLGFVEKTKAAPKEGIISLELKQSSAEKAGNTLRKFTPIFLIVLLVVAVTSILFFLKRVVFDTSWTSSVGEKSLYKVDYSKMEEKEGRAIELFVVNQNRNIGLRNVAIMKKGDVKTVGGRGSNFWIFLMPIPRNIGKISYDGETFVFEPIKKEFLLYPKSTLKDCLNRELTALTDKGKRIFFTFKPYISKRDRINKIIHLTDHTGLSEDTLGEK